MLDGVKHQPGRWRLLAFIGQADTRHLKASYIFGGQPHSSSARIPAAKTTCWSPTSRAAGRISSGSARHRLLPKDNPPLAAWRAVGWNWARRSVDSCRR